MTARASSFDELPVSPLDQLAREFEQADPSRIGTESRPATPDGRPTIALDEEPFHALLHRSIELLAQRSDVAVLDGLLQHVVPCPYGGPPRVRLAGRGLLREWLSEAANWVSDGGESRQHPSPVVVEALTEARHTWPGIRPAPDEAQPSDLADVLLEPDQHWLVDGWLPSGGLAVIGGPSHSGKSLFVLDGLLRMAHGEPSWFGQTVHAPASALYICGEGGPGLPQRFRAWKAAHPGARLATGQFVSVRRDMPNLSSEDAADNLQRIVGDIADRYGHAPNVVALDTWACALGGDENDAAVTAAALGALASLTRRFGCAVALVHHTRKPARGDVAATRPAMADLRGSGALTARADVVLMLDGKRVHLLKGRDGAPVAPRPYAVVPQPGGSATVLPAPDVAEEPNPGPAGDAMVQQAVEVLGAMGGAPSRRALVDAMKGRQEARWRGIDAALETGAIIDTGAGANRLRVAPRAVLPLPAPPLGGGSMGAGDCTVLPGSSGEQRGAVGATGQTLDDGMPEQPGGRRRRAKRSGGAA